MRKLMRTMCVGVFVAVMLQRSAAACCGWDDGYYAPMYYGPVVYGGGCYDCGYETVAYDCCDCGPCGECGAVATEGAPVETLQAPPVQATAPVAAPSNAQSLSTPAAQPQPPAAAETTPPPQLPPQPSATAPAKAEPGLFGTEATPPTSPAATPPAATPPKSAESTNDLFGAPAEKPATSTPPAGATPPSTATPPAGAAPSAGTTPPAAAPTDDLFGSPSKSETKAGTTTTTQKPADKSAAPDAKPADKPATPPAGNDKDKKEDKKAEKDLFGASPSILREAGGLASDEMRLWTDNTGSFSCRGRLVRVLDGHARLLKENGHTTTVPLGRLCARDLEFVNRQASAQHSELVKTAQTTVKMPASAN